MLINPVMKRHSVRLLHSNYGFSHFHNEFLRYTPKPMKVTNGISYSISKTCPYSAFIKFKCFYRILYWQYIEDYIRNHSVYAPSQWGMALHCNAISHWLGAYTGWSLLHTTRTTRTPAFWGYPPPPRDYPYYWPVHFESQVHTIDQFISDPKSKEGESRKN